MKISAPIRVINVFRGLQQWDDGRSCSCDTMPRYYLDEPYRSILDFTGRVTSLLGFGPPARGVCFGIWKLFRQGEIIVETSQFFFSTFSEVHPVYQLMFRGTLGKTSQSRPTFIIRGSSSGIILKSKFYLAGIPREFSKRPDSSRNEQQEFQREEYAKSSHQWVISPAYAPIPEQYVSITFWNKFVNASSSVCEGLRL